MSYANQVKEFSQLLDELSATSENEKFYECLERLGPLPRDIKDAKFEEYLDKFNLSFGSLLSKMQDYNETKYQMLELRMNTIIELSFPFIKKHQLDHILKRRSSSYFDSIEIGSGIDGKQLTQVTCANTCIPNQFACNNIGKNLCSNCRVIFYCSKDCQKMHWKFHKKFCKSEIVSKDWKPDYIHELRIPEFIQPTIASIPIYAIPVEYLWSNMPAIDILKLSLNELKDNKSTYKNSINLLFAASGDLNDVIATVNGISLDFNQEINIFINDFAKRVTIRNFVILYLLTKLGKNAIDAVIHIWYSSALTNEQWHKTTDLLANILYDKFDPHTKKDYLFDFDKLKIYTHFKPQTWKCLFEMVLCPIDLQTAIDMHTKIMLDPTRKDYLHQHMQGLTPGERICYDYFCRNGILLPYGVSNDALELGQKIKKKQFDRIYVSNICDEIYCGIKPVSTNLYPLLNNDNPHSTLIALFMNWLPSIPSSAAIESINNTIMKRLDINKSPSTLQDTLDRIVTLTTKADLEIHKIVPKRIYGSMKKDEQDKALSFEDERVRHLLYEVGFHTFKEHYVEWEIAT
ncbi:30638_t:CDS:2, partial [Gigaspora margarita]